MSRDSSVGIATKATEWTIGVRFSPGAGNSSLRHRGVHTGSEAHPASYVVCTGLFPGGGVGSEAAGAWNWPLIYI
jgi:hypothetical protein